MRRARIIALAIVVIGVVAGCSPTVTVVNTTKIQVQANVVDANGSCSINPSPGESSTCEVTEGNYSVTVVSEKNWLDYLTLTKKVLSDSLKSPNLTPAQVQDIQNRLKETSDKVNQLAATGGVGGSCSGNIGESGGGGTATISIGNDGSLSVSCS